MVLFGVRAFGLGTRVEGYQVLTVAMTQRTLSALKPEVKGTIVVQDFLNQQFVGERRRCGFWISRIWGYGLRV